MPFTKVYLDFTRNKIQGVRARRALEKLTWKKWLYYTYDIEYT